jgi:hypothetical protein
MDLSTGAAKSPAGARQLVQSGAPQRRGRHFIGNTAVDRLWSRWNARTNCNFSLPRSLRFPNACWRSRMFLPTAGRRFPEKRKRPPKILKIFFGVRAQMRG